MGVFRQTWFYTGLQGSTWEEIYDVEGNSARIATPKAGDNIVINKMALHHASVVLQSIETKDLENTDAPPTTVPINVSGRAKEVEGPPANQDEAAVILIVCATGDGKQASRKLWLRGLPEDSVKRDATSGRPVTSDAFTANLEVWLKGLQQSDGTTRKYGMRPRVRSAYGGAVPRFDIKTVAVGPNANTTTVGFGVNHGFNVNDIIQVNAANQKKLPGFKGPFRIIAKDAQTIVVAYKLPYDPSEPSGYVYKIDKSTFYPVKADASAFYQLGSRQTKKPGSRSRGRRSAVRLRR